ncbi:hypothetical protein C1645_831912 [Glomus cerebriforme]|uniref:Uncharacterized protein n=1 Tax=Glomus cerebriforme TaxID=658196 RepID=A0A397SF83_9GLOM|nr:hypothetical protein C1645_831912 [Glomus cerebriforme]
MEQSLLIVFGPSDGNNKFGLGADTDVDNDEFWLFDNDNEEDDDIEDDDVFSSKLYDGWDYKKDFGKDAWKKLYRNWEARQQHNALLDALAHPVKGLNLFEYDKLGFDLINNAKFQ